MRLGWVAMLCHVYELRHETRLGAMLAMYELRHEISVFMGSAEVPAFTDPLWMCDFAF